MAELTDHIRDYLVDEGIVREPRDAGALPPLWRNPREGAPAPGEKKGDENDNAAVVSVVDVGGTPDSFFESFKRIRVVDFWIRVAKWPTYPPLERAIRDALTDKRNWDMAGLTVIESMLWRGPNNLGANQQAFTFTVGYTFEIYKDPPP